MVTFARFNATSDSTHDDVSKPEANPLKDIVTSSVPALKFRLYKQICYPRRGKVSVYSSSYCSLIENSSSYSTCISITYFLFFSSVIELV